MAALSNIKRRIRSVGSTRQITKAMQLVAASKLRRAADTALGPQAYTAALREVLAGVATAANVGAHPLYRRSQGGSRLAIVIAGDRGLAGAYNSNVLRLLAGYVKRPGGPVQAIAIGRYAGRHLARLSRVAEIAAYPLDNGEAAASLVKPVLAEATRLFESGQVDQVDVLYTKFVSTVRQEPAMLQLLPVAAPEAGRPAGELEPDSDALLEYATRRLLEANLMQTILEARAAEQAARMLAMLNASDNAQSLIDDLTLSYNNARQAGITQEIAEISGGSEAMQS